MDTRKIGNASAAQTQEPTSWRGAPAAQLDAALSLVVKRVRLEAPSMSAAVAEARLRCNAHDALVAALERCEEALRVRENTLGDPCRLIEVRAMSTVAQDLARAALALARGGMKP